MTTTIGRAIDKCLRNFSIDKAVRQWEAVHIWEDVVGPKIASHTKTEKISFGKLFVAVDSPAWRNEISFQKENILKKLNKRLKSVKIKEIVLR